MSRLVHVSQIRGDDQNGDGSRELPVRTKHRAYQIADPGDLLCVDGIVLRPGMSTRRKAAVLAALVVAGWALVTWQNPSLGALLGGSLAITWAAIATEGKPSTERQAKKDRVQR